MNLKKITTITTAFILMTSFSYGQNDEIIIENSDSLKIKRINIGLKIGIPNIVGGSAEITLPILNNRISPYFDISGFNLEADDIETNFSYSEFGANVYLNQKGNGFFVSLGRGQFNTELTFNDLDFDGARGSATTDFDFGTTNIKLGLKSGGSFYFRFEVGYGIGDIPDSINFTATSGGITETFSEDIPPIPGLSSGGTIIGNIGFGFAF